MTTIHSNNSHKTLDANRQYVPQDLERQNLSELSTESEAPKAFAPDQELESPLTLNQQVEERAVIVAPQPIPAIQKRRITPKMAMIISGITIAIMGSAIAGNYVRTEQYKKIDQAKFLFAQACHTVTLSDAKSLDAAETGWNNATNQLQGIPPIPGFGIKDAQALTANYGWCQTNIEDTKLFQEAATLSQAARSAVQTAAVLPEDKWENHVKQLDSAIEHLKLIQTSSRDADGRISALPILQDTQSRLKEYTQVRKVAQTRLTQEHNAVQNFNAAKALHQRFEANQGISNPTERKSVVANLEAAIDRLEKIPPEGTTVSAAAIADRQTYAQKRYSYITEPQRQQLLQIAASFDRLSSALESGMTTEELSSSINGIANQLNQLPPLSTANQQSALRYFQAALDDYRFSQSLLNACNDSTQCITGLFWDNDVYLRNTSMYYRTLVDHYRVEPVKTLQGWVVRFKSVKEKTAFDAVWAYAARNVQKAEALIEQ